MQADNPDKPVAKRLPILPLRDVVVYPHTVIPLFVGRERSVTALDRAMAAGREILLVAQTQPDIDDPSAKDIYEIYGGISSGMFSGKVWIAPDNYNEMSVYSEANAAIPVGGFTATTKAQGVGFRGLLKASIL